MAQFRPLRADEIDIRVGTVGAKGVTFLLYKDARVDMNILDETYGVEGWQRDHKEIKGNLYCGVGVWSDKTNSWVWKWDCGTESYTEKEKGESSDSFKRACTNIGIGRELYTSPFIFISCETKKREGSKVYDIVDNKQFYGIKVSEIGYSDEGNARKITSLTIVNSKGEKIYSYGTPTKSAPKSTAKKKEEPKTEAVNGNMEEQIKFAKKEFIAECEKQGLNWADEARKYGLNGQSTLYDFLESTTKLRGLAD